MKNRNKFREQINWYLTDQINTARHEKKESLKTLALSCNVSINKLKNLDRAKLPELDRVCSHYNIDMCELLNKAMCYANAKS